jgi:IS30 family transposase
MTNKYKQLTLCERRTIEHSLDKQESFKSIARALGRSTGTISREVQRNSVQLKSGGFGVPFNECKHRSSCMEQWICEKEECRREYCRGCKLCNHVCSRFEPDYCTRLDKPPYVCNGCRVRTRCSLAKFVYKAKTAQNIYEQTLTDSRSGIAVNPDELKRIDEIVSPLIQKGQSPYHICRNNKDALMISDKTLYKYIAANCFGVSSMDLARKVKLRPRRKKRAVKVERSCRNGRTWDDYLDFRKENPDIQPVEMDTVVGARGSSKVLLTLYFPFSHFMLAFLRDANTALSVENVFKQIYERLGFEDFRLMFPVIITDNGPEFSAPSKIETDANGTQRTSVFFCDPYQSNQKAGCENNHRLIRSILPKGSSFDELTQSDVNLMMNHINSYARKSIGGQTPTEMFSCHFAVIDSLHEKLDISIVNPDDITLKPSLLK